MKIKGSTPRRPAPAERMPKIKFFRVEFLKDGDEWDKAFKLTFWKDCIPNIGDTIVVKSKRVEEAPVLYRITGRLFWFNSLNINTHARMIIEPWEFQEPCEEPDFDLDSLGQEKLEELHGSED